MSTTTAKSIFMAMAAVFVVSYFILTLFPNLPLLRKYTKPPNSNSGTPVDPWRCVGLASMFALFSPLVVVLFRAFSKQSTALSQRTSP